MAQHLDAVVVGVGVSNDTGTSISIHVSISTKDTAATCALGSGIASRKHGRTILTIFTAGTTVFGSSGSLGFFATTITRSAGIGASSPCALQGANRLFLFFLDVGGRSCRAISPVEQLVVQR